MAFFLNGFFSKWLLTPTINVGMCSKNDSVAFKEKRSKLFDMAFHNLFNFI